MHARCSNPGNPAYHNYGGRGITVCKRWDSFKAFAADMGPHPGNGLTFDRENNDKGYYKRNCRWATRRVQRHNQRPLKVPFGAARLIRTQYVPRGKKCLRFFAEKYKCTPQQIWNIVHEKQHIT
jgi:hypothetical protein